jgi:excisionase family DNA binding protein
VFTIAEVSKLTGRSPDILRRWAREGVIPARRAGHRYVIEPSAIDLIDGRGRVRLPRPE